MIELKNITKSYNVEKNKKNTVLNDISLSIEAGQMLAVTGRSGAGKTTLLNIIAGFQTIDSGKYYFNLMIYQNILQGKEMISGVEI